MNKELALNDIFPLMEEQLNMGGSTVFAIHGTSMQPFLKDRIASVRLEKPKSRPKKYDLIFYKRDDGNFILHRIVGSRGENFICRGDNQTENEYPVNDRQIIAVCTQYNRKGVWRDMGGVSQIMFSRFWVNTVIFRRVTRSVISFLRRK